MKNNEPDPAHEHFVPRRLMGLLADPVFGRFIGGRLLSTSGIWTYNIVAAIVTYQLTGSAFMVGLVSVAQFGPQVLLAPISGSMADRGNRGLQLMTGLTFVASGSGFLAVWIWAAGVDGLPGAWPLVGAAVVVGVGFVLMMPASDSLIPSLVRRGELPSAVSLNAIPPTLARAAGPAAGALVAASVGPAVAFALAAGANLAFVAILISLRIWAVHSAGRSEERGVRAAVRYLRVDTGIVLLLAGVVAVGIAADPAITLTPPLAATFGDEKHLVGLLASAFGLGSLITFVPLNWLNRRLGFASVATLGLILMAGGLLLAGMAPNAGLAALSFAIAGAGMTMALIGFTTQLQQRLPDGVRGRVMAFWAMAYVGVRPFAAAVNGAVTDLATVSMALAVVAAVVSLIAWISRPSAVAARPAP